jgi:hypothetical protein
MPQATSRFAYDRSTVRRQRNRFALLTTAGIAFALLPAQAASPKQTSLPCPEAHRCHHVFHVLPATTGNNRVAWDSKQLFPPGPIGVSVAYSPHLYFDGPLREEPIGDCGLHFWVPGRFTGVATRCGDGSIPLHVQVANVYKKHLRVGVTFWTPAPLFTG